jgi:hypothetical protein
VATLLSCRRTAGDGSGKRPASREAPNRLTKRQANTENPPRSAPGCRPAYPVALFRCPVALLPCRVDLRWPPNGRPAAPRAEGCFGRLPSTLWRRMSCDGPVACRRNPRHRAADSPRRVPSFVRAHRVPAPLPTSACVPLPVSREVVLRTRRPRRARPPGVTRRPESARGVASRCRPSWPSSPRPPRARSWSRMPPTLQAVAPRCPAPLKGKSLRKHDGWLGPRA